MSTFSINPVGFLTPPDTSISPTPAPCTIKTCSIFFKRLIISISTVEFSISPIAVIILVKRLIGNTFEASLKPTNRFRIVSNSVTDNVRGNSNSHPSGAKSPTNAPLSLRISILICFPVVVKVH